jgi:hypothetical protein
VVGDSVVDALDDPAEQAAGLAGGALGGDVGRGGGWVGQTLEDFDVEDSGGRGDTDDEAGAGADGAGR